MLKLEIVESVVNRLDIKDPRHGIELCVSVVLREIRDRLDRGLGYNPEKRSVMQIIDDMERGE